MDAQTMYMMSAASSAGLSEGGILLPQGYTKVAGLTGGYNNSSYIVITGLTAIDNPQLEVTVSNVSVSSSHAAAVANMYAYSGLSVYCNTTNVYGVRSGYGTQYTSTSCNTDTRYKIRVWEENIGNIRYNQQLIIDSTTISDTTTAESTSDKNYTSLGLFCALSGNAYYASYSKYILTATIYGCKVYDESDNLKVHLVPCLDADGVPCFYDAVRYTTHYNNGSGTFGVVYN